MMQRARISNGRRMRSVLLCSLLAMTAWACGDDEPAADQDDDDVTTTSPAEASADDPDDPVASATDFWEAVIAGDRATAVGFIGPAPAGEEPQGLFGAAPTLERQLDWYEAVDWQWTLGGCAPDAADPSLVVCEVTARNAWSEAMDVDPVPGTFFMQFDDDGFVTLDSNFGERWLPQVYQPFNAWVSANHPEDAEIMWDSPDDVLSDEALELFEVNTERFVAAQAGA